MQGVGLVVRKGGLSWADSKVVLGPRGDIEGRAVSARTVGKDGGQGEHSRIRALYVR